MKRKLYLPMLMAFCLFFNTRSFADVTLSSSAIAAANIGQGTNYNPVYIVKMNVTTSAVSTTSMQFTLTGTHDNDDLSNVVVWFNTTPSLSGANPLVNVSGLFAAPHTYTVSVFQAVAAGATGYFIITVSPAAAASNGHTVKLDGALNPVSFVFSTSPTVTNNQTDAAGLQTILAAGVTLTTSTIAAANIAQGTNHSIVYIAKMDVALFPVIVNNLQFILTGTHDNNDLLNVVVWFNTTPSLSGATPLVNVSGLFAAPHTYNVGITTNIASGATGYFIITVSTDASATSGNTVKVDGAVNPVIFGFATSPTITNNQTNAAGLQTILAAGVTLTTSAIAAANIAQGTNHSIVYIAKMDVALLPVIINSLQFTLTGTHDNNDLINVVVWFNTTPSLSGATPLVNVSGLFAAPHTYNVGITRNIAAGASGYFIITVSTDASATSGNTVKLDGAVNPVIFGFTTSPTITDNQTNAAGLQTILAAGVTLTTTAIAAANIAQGTSGNIIYAVKMDVTSLPVAVNSIQFTLTGTHDNNDLTNVIIWFNTTPSLSGATPLSNNSGLFAAPHTYNVSSPANIVAGASGYFIIAVTTDPVANSSHTVKVDGLANPVTFGYTTVPPVTNNQTDAAGTQTILGAGITLTTPSLAASTIVRGTNNNIVYIAKMDVASLPITINSCQFTLTGTHDNNDLNKVTVYYNAAAPTVSGAINLNNNISGLFAAPHTYNVPFTNVGSINIAAGASGYFIVTVDLDAAATFGNTVKLDGAANPVSFAYATAPVVTNNQTNAAGTQTITSALPLTLISFTGSLINTQEVQLQWITAGELNTRDFEIEWSIDGLHFNKIAVLQAAGNSSQNKQYRYIHKLPVDGNNYYRLKMTDKDGQFTYSIVVKIKITITVTDITVFPNPVTDYLYLQVRAIKNESILFYLHGADGKTIASKSFTVSKGNNQLSWNIQQLAAGNYFISSGDKQFETIKIIKN